MSSIRIFHLVAFSLLAAIPTTAQNARQLAERHVRSMTIRTVDDRKGKHEIRIVRTTYDRKGHELESVESDSAGIVLERTVRTYDRKGRELSVAVHDGSGAELERTVSTWDRWGDRIEQQEYRKGGLERTTRYTYDKYGDKQKEVVTDANGTVTSYTVLIYEGRGLLKRRVTYDGKDRPVLERTYEYDH